MRSIIDAADFDAQLTRIRSKQAFGMADLGELFEIEERLRDDDAGSWYSAFFSMAERLSTAAAGAQAAADSPMARNLYLRASEYYRAAFHYLRGDLDSPRLQTAYAAHQDAFQRALPLLEHPLEAATVAIDGFSLPGYFGTPDRSGRPRPCVIVASGLDSTAEELYPCVLAGVRRGYNVFALDGPGQGAALYRDRLFMRPDWESIMPAVVDAVSTRSDVDADRVILLGREVGALLMARAAAHESQVAALVLVPGWYDFAAELFGQLPPSLRAEVDAEDPAASARLQALLDDPRWRRALLPLLASHGIGSVREYLRQSRRYTLAEHIAHIGCPTLVCGYSGHETQARQVYDGLPGRKTWLRIACVDPAAAPRDLFYDWLDSVLGPP